MGLVVMDEDIQMLKILSDVATSLFITRKSNISRIKATNFTEAAKKDFIKQTMNPIDESLFDIKRDIKNILNRIPIYNFFLSQQNGVSIFDAAQLISLIKDISLFNGFGKLMSYTGFIPNSRNYNKKLHKLLLRIGYKLIQKNPQYQFIFELNCQKYSEKYPKRSQAYIENMAKRIVIKKFLKNLYFSWNSINKDEV